jgi:hypothetical protein
VDLVREQKIAALKEAAETRKLQLAHDKACKTLIEGITDLLTSDVFSSEDLQILRSVRLYFDRAREIGNLAEQIAELEEKPALKRSLLIASLLAVAEQMI